MKTVLHIVSSSSSICILLLLLGHRFKLGCCYETLHVKAFEPHRGVRLAPLLQDVCFSFGILCPMQLYHQLQAPCLQQRCGCCNLSNAQPLRRRLAMVDGGSGDAAARGIGEVAVLLTAVCWASSRSICPTLTSNAPFTSVVLWSS